MAAVSTDIRIGDCLDTLKAMPDASVHMVWTSPPYWALRDYGCEPVVRGGDPECEHEWASNIARTTDSAPSDKSTLKGNGHAGGGPSLHRDRTPSVTDTCTRCGAWRGQLGLEPSLEAWIANQVEVFREVRRALRPDGTLWLNVGDAYSTGANGRPADQVAELGSDNRRFRDKPQMQYGALKAKQRLMLPARLALALQADGWWLRDEIVWSKANPMPSSVKDRTTPAHEMLYMLSPGPRYFYDAVAIQEPIAESSVSRLAQPTISTQQGGAKQDAYEVSGVNARNGSRRPNEVVQAMAASGAKTRQKRSVWHMALQPYDEAHFATAPQSLVAPCILAGTSQKGVCPECGAPWVRQSSRRFQAQADVSPERGVRCADGQKPMDPTSGWDGFPRGTTTHETTGFAPSCSCPDHAPVPATVLDPYGGAGTTGLVAEQLGRDCILIERKPEYAQMARDRIRREMGRVRCDGMEEPSTADLPLLANLGGAE